MPFIHLAQATDVPDAEVVEQAARVIDTFSSLGPFMAVLLVITLAFIVVLVVVWSTRSTSSTAVTVLAQVNADKINELVEMRRQRDEENKVERERHQQRHDQFMLMFAAINNKQVEGDEAIASSLTGTKTSIIHSVEGARDDIVEGLKEYRSFNIIMLDMLLQDPPAGRSRIKRAMKAYAEGDMRKAQAVADESEPRTEVTATTETPAVTLPAEVVITDVSPEAVASIMSAMPAADTGASTEGGESEDAA